MNDYQRTQQGGHAESNPILKRLDEVSALIDDGKLSKAREKLSGSAWLLGEKNGAISAGVLRGVQQWVDAAHDVLSTSAPDATLVRDILHQARKVVVSGPFPRAG